MKLAFRENMNALKSTEFFLSLGKWTFVFFLVKGLLWLLLAGGMVYFGMA